MDPCLGDGLGKKDEYHIFFLLSEEEEEEDTDERSRAR